VSHRLTVRVPILASQTCRTYSNFGDHIIKFADDAYLLTRVPVTLR